MQDRLSRMLLSLMPIADYRKACGYAMCLAMQLRCEVAVERRPGDAWGVRVADRGTLDPR